MWQVIHIPHARHWHFQYFATKQSAFEFQLKLKAVSVIHSHIWNEALRCPTVCLLPCLLPSSPSSTPAFPHKYFGLTWSRWAGREYLGDPVMQTEDLWNSRRRLRSSWILCGCKNVTFHTKKHQRTANFFLFIYCVTQPDPDKENPLSSLEFYVIWIHS